MLLLKIALLGIVINVSFSFIVFALSCAGQTSTQVMVIIATIPFVLVNCIALLHPKLDQSTQSFKETVIASTVGSMFAVVAASYFVIFTEQQRIATYSRLAIAFVSLCTGFVFYQTHIPERFLGRYRIVQLCLNSHGFWHLFCFLGEYHIFWSCFELNLGKQR